MRHRLPLLLLLVCFAFSVPTAQDSRAESPKKLLMAVLGDSITAATFADLPIPYDPVPEERVRKWAIQGQDSRFILINKRTLSWASGVKIESQFVRLRRWLKAHGERRKLVVDNVAFPGDTTYDLEGQANQIAEKMKTGEYDAIKYVTILIGANDACSGKTPIGSPLEDMRANLLKAVTILSRIPQAEPLRILLVGIPRIPDLGTPAFRNAKTIFGLSCHKVRNQILDLCNSRLSWSTPDEYGADMQIIEDKNRLLRMVVEEVNTAFPNVEMVYSNRLYNLAIPIGILAIDCFHPNKFAQGEIARQTWLDQPWFE